MNWWKPKKQNCLGLGFLISSVNVCLLGLQKFESKLCDNLEVSVRQYLSLCFPCLSNSCWFSCPLISTIKCVELLPVFTYKTDFTYERINVLSLSHNSEGWYPFIDLSAQSLAWHCEPVLLSFIALGVLFICFNTIYWNFYYLFHLFGIFFR